MKRHLIAAVSSAASAVLCVWPFGTHWWTVAPGAASVPLAYIATIRHYRAIERANPDA